MKQQSSVTQYWTNKSVDYVRWFNKQPCWSQYGTFSSLVLGSLKTWSIIFQQSDFNVYQMSTKMSHTYNMWNHPSNSWRLLFCFVDCTPLQTLQRTDKHTHFAENLTGCRNSSPICKFHNMVSHLQPLNKEYCFEIQNLLNEPEEKQLQWLATKKNRKNKDTEKGITV